MCEAQLLEAVLAAPGELGPRIVYADWLAGRSLRVFARVGTNDATNSFKAYQADFVRRVGIESDPGGAAGERREPAGRGHDPGR